MKISSLEFNRIKTEIPNVIKLITEDFFDLKNFIDENNYTRVAFCPWDHWLQMDELQLMYPKSKDDLINSFRALLISLYQKDDIFIFKDNKWKKKMVIEKPNSLSHLLKNSNLSQLSADSSNNFQFVLPKYKAILEMGFDWTGNLVYLENENTHELIQKIKTSNLHILEYQE